MPYAFNYALNIWFLLRWKDTERPSGDNIMSKPQSGFKGFTSGRWWNLTHDNIFHTRYVSLVSEAKLVLVLKFFLQLSFIACIPDLNLTLSELYVPRFQFKNFVAGFDVRF